MSKNPSSAMYAESVTKQFDYSSSLDIESAQSSFFEEKISPVSGNTNPYEFVIEGLGQSFIAMNTIKLGCRMRILQHNKSPIGVNDLVCPISHLKGSLWKSIEVRLNGTLINQGSETNIAHKSYNETLLSYERTRGANVTATYGMNFAYTDNLQEFDIMAELPVDFFRSDNYLAPNNTLTIVCTRNPDEFVLVGLKTAQPFISYSLEIMDIALHVRRIHLQHDLTSQVVSLSKPQRYISKCSKMKTLLVPVGMKNFRKVISVGDVLPKQVIISQVTSKAYNGTIDTDPLFYAHFDLCRINLKIDNKQIPTVPLTPDFRNELIARELMHLQRNSGKGHVDRNLNISYLKFLTDSAVFPFDLNPDQCNGEHIHLSTFGTLEVEIDWLYALQSDIIVLVHLIYNQVVTVPPNGGSPIVEIF